MVDSSAWWQDESALCHYLRPASVRRRGALPLLRIADSVPAKAAMPQASEQMTDAQMDTYTARTTRSDREGAIKRGRA